MTVSIQDRLEYYRELQANNDPSLLPTAEGYTRAFDGTVVPERGEPAPCGNETYFDHDSGYAYRCSACMAVVGSTGMPRECYNLMKTMEILQSGKKDV
tara:strand:- start:117082 stop:117375 length:294 start_codon:yes stop_codon:yes gene_type:complete